MHWRWDWEPDEYAPLSWECREAILGYCSNTCTLDSTNVRWIICTKSHTKVLWRNWFFWKKSVDFTQKNQVYHFKCVPNSMLSKLARSNWYSKDHEISSHHFSDGNTCLLSSCCCCLEGDNNWLWIQVYLSIDQWFFEAKLRCQYYLCWNKLWLWNISTK